MLIVLLTTLRTTSATSCSQQHMAGYMVILLSQSTMLSHRTIKRDKQRMNPVIHSVTSLQQSLEEANRVQHVEETNAPAGSADERHNLAQLQQ